MLGYWRGVSLPFPDNGVRLIRRDQIEEFNNRMVAFQNDLGYAVEELDRNLLEIRSQARMRLGRLFDPADYPDSLADCFEIAWDFPAIEPPHYLLRLSPELYREQSARVRERFEEAAALAEEAFCEELSKLTSHLAERLQGNEDGRPKVFRDSAIENLHAFFERFRQLNITSSDQLEEAVGQAQRAIQGVAPGRLRTNDGLRRQVAADLDNVRGSLDALMVDRPRRNLIRRPR